MPWKNVSIAERERLLKVYEAGDAAQLAQEATDIGVLPQTLERELRRHREYRDAYINEAAFNADFAPSPSRRYVDFEQIDGDDFIVISDIEIPDHNPLYLLLALLSAMRHGIRKCIIAGDLIATDQPGLVSWVATWVESGELNYEDAVALVVMILREFEKWFEIIIVIEGNHDDRVARATQGQVHFGMLLNGTTKVVYSRYAYLHLNTSRGLVWVVHPSNFSSDPITLGQKLYSTHAPKGHWVVAHTHRRQDGWSPDGAFEVHALGCGRDGSRTKYKATKINTHKAWDSSFLVIRGGYHYPLDLKSTNWREELGPLYDILVQHPVYLRTLDEAEADGKHARAAVSTQEVLNLNSMFRQRKLQLGHDFRRGGYLREVQPGEFLVKHPAGSIIHQRSIEDVLVAAQVETLSSVANACLPVTVLSQADAFVSTRRVALQPFVCLVLTPRGEAQIRAATIASSSLPRFDAGNVIDLESRWNGMTEHPGHDQAMHIDSTSCAVGVAFVVDSVATAVTPPATDSDEGFGILLIDEGEVAFTEGDLHEVAFQWECVAGQ